jgi:myo-inositol-1(or 4)-monophosphatase
VPNDLAQDLDLALRAARRAGAAVLPMFHTGQEVRYKGPDQPVTAADLKADRILADVLRAARPEYGWLSEETADAPERLERPRVWVVDPIDGTSSFVKGRGEWVVSVGLVEDGEAVLGVVHNPATDETYHAVRGGGAYLNDAPIRVSGTPGSEAQPRMAASHWDAAHGEWRLAGHAWEMVPLGSTAYKMVKVADGTVDAYVSLGPKAEWDVCAPHVIVTEAGGRVTCPDGSAVRYNRSDPSWEGIAASNGRLHSAAMNLLW